MNAPDLNAPPLSPPGGPSRSAIVVAVSLCFLALGVCLIGVVRAKIHSDAEDAVVRDWDPTARKLCAILAKAPAGEAAPRQGTLLPIRVDEISKEGRVDFHVFLSLPAEWRPDRQGPPSQVVILTYRDAELRHYGQSAKGGDQVRYRQACTLRLYDLGRQELIAERELLSPDPLPESFGEAARLFVAPELVVAELRALSGPAR